MPLSFPPLAKISHNNLNLIIFTDILENLDKYKDTVISDNPIFYYRVNELSGIMLMSLVNSAQNNANYVGGVTLGQPSAIVGNIVDKSILLNGTTGYVKTSNHPNINGDCSVEVWVKTGSFSNMAVFSKTPDFFAGFASGRVYFFDFAADGVAHFAPGFYNDNLWHHIVFTRQNSLGNGTKLYIDGVLVVIASTTVVRDSEKCSFGAFLTETSESPSQFLAGNLDEIAVYNSVLSPTQVLSHYNASL